MVVINDAIYIDSNSAIRTSSVNDWGWYYKEEDLLLVFRLKKEFFFSRWEVEIIEHKGIDDIVIDKIKYRNKRPHHIEDARVKINNVWQNVAFNQNQRISISYYENLKNSGNVDFDKVVLIPDTGYSQSYLFFMLGSTNNGKSCWIYALNTTKVRNRAIEQYEKNAGKCLVPCNDTAAYGIVAPTAPDKVLFNNFKVKKKNNDEQSKLVFIVDLGGELANYKKADQYVNARRNIVAKIRRYATGIFVVRNEEWLYDNRSEADQNDPTSLIYNELLDGEDRLSEQQVCYILTGADRIKKDITEDTQLGEKLNLAPNSLIFCDTDGSKDQMQKNMSIASGLMKKRDRRIANSPCFAISSCNKDTEGTMLNFEKGYNAELPFIYMLENFGI